MENYTAVFILNEDEDDDDEQINHRFEPLNCGVIKFYNENNNIFAEYDVNLNFIGNFYENNLLSNEEKKTMFEKFVDDVNLNKNCKINFKQTNGEISIIKNKDIISFIIMGEYYGATFNVKINESMLNVFNTMVN